MKKLTAFLLTILLASIAVVGCDKAAPNEASKGNETNQSETSAQSEDITKDYDQDDSQQGFTIYGKKYYYKGHSFSDQYTGYSEGDVLILTVTNETDTDYKARVKVTFLDQNGEKLKTDSKSFTQYIAGYTNYFIFQAGEEYASYTCDLTLTEISEEERADILVDKLIMSYEGLRERFTLDAEKFYSEGVINEVPGILGRTICSFTGEVPRKCVTGYLVLFGNTGEIYIIDNCGAMTYAPAPSDHYIYFERENKSKVVWPEELKGELTALVFPVKIEDVKTPQIPQ